MYGFDDWPQEDPKQMKMSDFPKAKKGNNIEPAKEKEKKWYDYGDEDWNEGDEEEEEDTKPVKKVAKKSAAYSAFSNLKDKNRPETKYEAFMKFCAEEDIILNKQKKEKEIEQEKNKKEIEDNPVIKKDAKPAPVAAPEPAVTIDNWFKAESAPPVNPWMAKPSVFAENPNVPKTNYDGTAKINDPTKKKVRTQVFNGFATSDSEDSNASEF